MTPKFLSTKKMAEYLGYHPDFLRKNMGVLFFEREHYFKPPGTRALRWNVEKMTAWVTAKNLSETSQQVLNKILA